MKKVAGLLALVLIGMSVYEVHAGRIGGAILFIVWSFYLRYLSDKSE